MSLILCGCGCGELLEEIASYLHGGKPYKRTYISGHQWRGKRRPTHEKPDANRASKHETARIRARGQTACALERIGGCKGGFDVHHRDGDPWNNEPGNLVKLCRAHHRLVETGKIDLANPVMPAFFTDSSGKRRYSYRWSGGKAEG